MLKVAVDISCCSYSRRGVARYTCCLLAALRQIPDIETHKITFPVANFGYAQPARAIKTLTREFLWQPFVAPIQASRHQVALLHTACNPCVTPPRGRPRISTLHDLEIFHHPQRFRRWTRWRFPLEAKAYRTATRLICVSQATADDAMRFLDVAAARIEVVPLGSQFSAASAEARPELPLPPEFFLFVSAIEPGKNLRLLADAYQLASAQGKNLPKLLVVGERVPGVATEGATPDSWIFTGRLSDENLCYLYRRALALLAPTKYEGFGLPVLEAMTLGTPVICSRVSSLPEVGGDVPIYAEQSPPAYLAAMARVLAEPHLRAERIAAGQERSRDFSWDRCANQTAAIYRSVASHG